MDAAPTPARKLSQRPPRPRTLWLALILLVASFDVAGCRSGRDEALIHKEQTDHYTIWVFEDDRGIRRLRFAEDGVDQSAVKPGDPTHLEFSYTRATIGAYALRADAERVLIVGLGGGSLPMYLRHHRPELQIDVVEIDPAVARVAKRHLGLRTDPGMRLHIDDGRAWIARAERRWDVVILDAYGPDAIPRALTTEAFLTSVRDRLSPGGIVIANIWAERFNPLYPRMLSTYRAVFDEVHGIKGRGTESRVIVASPRDEGWSRAGFIAAARALREAWGVGFDLASLIDEGYLAPEALPAEGPVLVD